MKPNSPFWPDTTNMEKSALGSVINEFLLILELFLNKQHVSIKNTCNLDVISKSCSGYLVCTVHCCVFLPLGDICFARCLNIFCIYIYMIVYVAYKIIYSKC